MQNQAELPIVIEQQGAVGLATLNRPAALNALNAPILEGLKGALLAWREDPSVSCIVLQGAGERGFCAGGDLKHFHAIGQAYKKGEAGLDAPVDFFRLEYGLNHLLYHYPKPIVALAQGITMGGGYGLAGNANIRVAFEDTQFAMPESKIGFFPDVGAVAHLAKAPAHIGRYLAMSGNTLDGASMTLVGLADYYAQKGSANNILADIVKAQPQNKAAVEAIVKDHALTLSETKDFENLKQFCAAHFGFTDAKTILESLAASNDSMAASVLADIRARSPLSVLVALGHYNRAAEAGDFDSVIERDLQLCAHHIRGHDLYEGIRALLLDKDKNPRWEHARIEDILPGAAEAYFQPIVPKLEPL